MDDASFAPALLGVLEDEVQQRRLQREAAMRSGDHDLERTIDAYETLLGALRPSAAAI